MKGNDDMTEKISDGKYTVEITLTGGGGKASVSSPARLDIKDGEMTAEIEWSSPYYDLMTVYGDEYYPQNTEGNSIFYVTVPALDSDIPITARTTAMSVPHDVEYTLRFDSGTVKTYGGNIAESIFTGAVFLAALALLIIKGKNYVQK